jgi:hypothetical protein
MNTSLQKFCLSGFGLLAGAIPFYRAMGLGRVEMSAAIGLRDDVEAADLRPLARTCDGRRPGAATFSAGGVRKGWLASSLRAGARGLKSIPHRNATPGSMNRASSPLVRNSA